MKKRFLTLVSLVLAAVMLFTACGTAEFDEAEAAENLELLGSLIQAMEAEELISEEAVKEVLKFALGGNTVEQASLIGVGIDVAMDMVGVPMGNVTGEIYVASADTSDKNSDMAMEITMSVEMFDEVANQMYTAAYRKDGMLYEIENGERTKSASGDSKGFTEAIDGVLEGFSFDTSSEDFWNSIELESYDISDDILWFEMSVGESLTDDFDMTSGILSKIFGGDSMGTLLNEEGFTLNGATLTLGVDYDGVFRSMVIELVMSGEMADMTGFVMGMAMRIELTLFEFGGTEITFPDDLDEYELVD